MSEFESALDKLEIAINNAKENEEFLKGLPGDLSNISEKIGQIKNKVQQIINRIKDISETIVTNGRQIQEFTEKIELLETRVTELTTRNEGLETSKNEMNALIEQSRAEFERGNQKKAEELLQKLSEKETEFNTAKEAYKRTQEDEKSILQQQIITLRQENERLNSIISRASPLVNNATEILENFSNPSYKVNIQQEIDEINKVIQELIVITNTNTNTEPISSTSSSSSSSTSSSSSSTPSGVINIDGDNIIINTNTGKQVTITRVDFIPCIRTFTQEIIENTSEPTNELDETEMKILLNTIISKNKSITANEKFNIFIRYLVQKIGILDLQNTYSPDELLDIFVNVGIKNKDIDQYLKNIQEPGKEPKGGKTKKNKNKTKKNKNKTKKNKNKTKKMKKIRKYKGGFKYSTSSNRKSSKRSFTSSRNTPSKRSSSRRTTVSSRSK